MTPDVFTIPWDVMARAKTKAECTEFIFGIIKQECLCEHIAYKHTMQRYARPDRCEEIMIFIECGICPCKLFKRDNLKFLEDKANG